MSSFSELAANEALRATLGKLATFRRYDRQNRTPMNFVLNEVERHIGNAFSVYWVDNGPPDVFCLPGLQPAPVVFNVRYLILAAALRRLITSPASGEELLVENANRFSLLLIAELALHYGDPDFATLAFCKAVTGMDFFIHQFGDEKEQLAPLEHTPISESYMAIWFFGLVHEMGHLDPSQSKQFDAGHWMSDDWIAGLIEVALDRFHAYTLPVREKAKQAAKSGDSVLAVSHLRSEALADLFATAVLFQSTLDIMREIGRERFSGPQFVAEMTVILNVVAVIDRCRRVAIAASATEQEATDWDMGFHPVAMHVRGHIQRDCLESLIARWAYGEEPSKEDRETVAKSFDSIVKGLGPKIDALDTGLNRTMEFALFPSRRKLDWDILEDLRAHLLGSDSGGVGRILSAQFCNMAAAMMKDGKLLRALRGIVDDPGQPLRPDPTGDLIYLVPFVHGQGDRRRPFGLDTKHGHIVFVFIREQLFDEYFKISAGGLKSGFELKRAVVAVPRAEQLGPLLASSMPANFAFQIAVEGTDEFDFHFRELVEDTIWQ
jgi:hypothetical protein